MYVGEGWRRAVTFCGETLVSFLVIYFLRDIINKYDLHDDMQESHII